MISILALVVITWGDVDYKCQREHDLKQIKCNMIAQRVK